jgi:hypothetical protein
MADITKCTGLGCPLKESCYRYTAKETPHWQSYFVDVPYNEKGDKQCSELWLNRSIVIKKKRGRKKKLT